LDPVTLELSLLFHPAAKALFDGWPTIDQAASWPDLDLYTKNCPVADLIRQCRDWVFAAPGVGDKGAYACVYSYCLRQLQFAGTNHDLAKVIAHAAIKKILE
jgi:hypothetical protein